ncbi:MAG TPA: zf-HC2 domain-containing protein [Thermoanaerobaculia bacterium]|nr:zf-HC2 domain-containing protein [Thermoanaerobaculia bacterium]
MSENEPEIRQAVMDWMAAAGPPGEHLDPETLAAYHARELPDEEERRLQDHLLVCRECAELLLDLEGLGDPGFGRDVEIPAGTGEALWERLRQETQPKTVLPFAPRRRAVPPPWMSALAAALLVAVIGLSVWVAALRQTVEKLSQPEVNARVLELVPLGTQARGETATATEVPSRDERFTLVLSNQKRGDFQAYEAELVRTGGGVVRRETGLVPNPNVYGSFTLGETRSALGAGDYRIRLFGLRGGRRELLGEYALRILP